MRRNQIKRYKTLFEIKLNTIFNVLSVLLVATHREPLPQVFCGIINKFKLNK